MTESQNKKKRKYKKIDQPVQNSLDLSKLDYFLKSSIQHTKNFIQSLQKKEEVSLAVYEDPKLCIQSPKKGFSSTLAKGLGFISVLFGIILLLSGIFSGDPELLISAIVFLVPGIPAFIMGSNRLGLNKRYQKYLREIQNNPAVLVDDLAVTAQQDRKKTVKDLQKLIDEDYFPQGRLVENQTMLILNRETYDLYKENRARNGISKDKYTYVEDYQVLESGDNYADLILKANDFLQKINVLKKQIKDPIFAKVVEENKELTQVILKRVDDHPELVPLVHRFDDYYLPTTLKLVGSYIDLEKGSQYTTELEGSLEKISKSVRSINNAYRQLLLRLYENERLDIQMETSVLDTVIKSDGLNELQ